MFKHRIFALGITQYIMEINRKTGLKKILIGGLILLLAGVGIIWYIFTEKFTDTSELKAEYTMRAVDLLKEFQQNDSLANKKYTEKIIAIKGIVSEIKAAAGDTSVNIKMADPATGDYLIFTFQQQHLAEAKAVKQGEEIAVKASCSGGIYSEILDSRYVSFKRAALDR